MNITTTPATFHSLRRVLIVHGYAAAPDAHWFPWLRDSLQTTGIGAAVVTLPTPDAPKAAAWTDAAAEAIGVPDAGTWIVAHSLGGITVLRALATLTEPWQLGGLILVSGFTGALKSLPVLDEYLSTDIDAERIAKNIGIRAMVRSDADASCQRQHPTNLHNGSTRNCTYSPAPAISSPKMECPTSHLCWSLCSGRTKFPPKSAERGCVCFRGTVPYPVPLMDLKLCPFRYPLSGSMPPSTPPLR